jgi:hypothetical protein
MLVVEGRSGALLATRPAAGGPTYDLRRLLDAVGPTTRARVPLVAAAAGLVRRMHEAGVMHRDLTLGNFVGTGPEDLALVDLNRARCFDGPLPPHLRHRDLSAMRVCPCPSIGPGYPRRPACALTAPCGRLDLWAAYAGGADPATVGTRDAYLRAVARAKRRFYWDTRFRFWTRHRHAPGHSPP